MACSCYFLKGSKMIVNFTPQNYFQKSSVMTQKTSFKGNERNFPTTEELLAEINSLADVEPTRRADRLNNIAIGVFNNPSVADPRLVKAAIIFIPAEDEKFSASKYATELLRLTKYACAGKELQEEVREAIRSAKTSRTLEQAAKGFQKTHRNICGMAISMDEALGYKLGPQRKGRTFKDSYEC